MDVEGAVPTEVGREAERAADVLRRLGTTVAPPWHTAYHTRFLERYGTGQVVPVLDLLNPDRGLGLPRDDDSAEARPRRGDRLLGELLVSAVRDRRAEVVLDAALIEALANGAPEPPASMELCVELLTRDWDSLNANDFLLAIGEYPGLSAVGTSVGRFAHLFPEHREELHRLVRTGVPTERAAQLAFRTRVPRSANVTSVPQWLPRRIPIGCGPATTPATDLALADLAVGATTERLFLLDASGTPVAPVSYSALNPRSGHVPPTARFLLELGELDTPRCRPWNWGTFSGAPYAPRVRSGRTILAPARWLPERHLLDGDRWENDLREWRDRWDVPAVVRLAMMDHRIEVDLEDPVHREVFRDELRKTPGLQVQEAFAGTHACEVLIPLYGPPRRDRRPKGFARPRCDVVHLPGGEWLYAKLYASDAAQRQILADHLDFSDVDTWFFVRYEDPEPHLRLRFHGRPAELNVRLLPRLNTWAAELRAAGLTSGLTVDTYRPEIERYGAMAEAEAVFHADSQVAIALLRRSVEMTTAAHSVLDLLLAFRQPDELLHVLDTLTGVEERRAVARKDADALAERLEEDEPSFVARRQAVDVYLRALRSAPIHVGLSLAHMHCNRLFGPDRAKESAVYALLRSGLARSLGRKRHGT
ncbi:lantibiotic dehydratase [Kutzneria chonburiensis]|nr:lantibiotic dehydratase [Kutzneria chonburiensis]